MIIIIYISLGLVAGLLSGMLGIGGGIIIVPVLQILFLSQAFEPSVAMHMAVGTSLGIMVFSTTASSLSHHRMGSLNRALLLKLIPGLILGAVCGALIADGLSGHQLKASFSALLVITASKMLFWHQEAHPDESRSFSWAYSLIGFFIGSIAGMLGIGGGVLMVPILLYCHIPLTQATAVSAASALPIAIFGALTNIYTGLNETDLPPGTLGHIYLPAMLAVGFSAVLAAPLGAYLSHKLPKKWLKKGFALLMLVVSFKMFPYTIF